MVDVFVGEKEGERKERGTARLCLARLHTGAHRPAQAATRSAAGEVHGRVTGNEGGESQDSTCIVYHLLCE